MLDEESHGPFGRKVELTVAGRSQTLMSAIIRPWSDTSRRVVAVSEGGGRQAPAVLGGAAGRADQRSETGRINERDPVQVNDQRPSTVRELEQALP